MTLTLSVKHLTAFPRDAGPLFVTGILWLDAAGATLYDEDGAQVVPLADPEACAALRATLPPPGEYLGGALLQGWVREGPDGPELHGIYWVLLGDFQRAPPSRWGPEVPVRPVPREYDDSRPAEGDWAGR